METTKRTVFVDFIGLFVLRCVSKAKSLIVFDLGRWLGRIGSQVVDLTKTVIFAEWCVAALAGWSTPKRIATHMDHLKCPKELDISALAQKNNVQIYKQTLLT